MIPIDMPKVVITEARRARDAQARMRELSARTGASVEQRRGRGTDKIFQATGADFLYVVGQNREKIVARNGGELFVHRGLFDMRRQQKENPIAKWFSGEEKIVDATCGLAQDALLISDAGPRVSAYERSPWVYALLEHGVERLRQQADECGMAAQRIQLHCDDILLQGDNTAEVLYIDRMWTEHTKASAAMRVLRSLVESAEDEPFQLDRFPRLRKLVCKTGLSDPIPLGVDWTEQRRTARAVYWRWDVTGK